MPTLSFNARLEAVVGSELYSVLKRAAELQGQTVTDFVVSAAQDAARQTIEQVEVIKLSPTDQQYFAETLLSPPPLAPAMKRAFANRKELFGTE